MTRIQLTPADISANKQDQLSPAQAARLCQRRQVWLVGTLGLVLLGAAVTAVLLLKLLLPTFASRGELFIALPLALFWAWLLRHSPQQWQRVNQDIQAGEVTFITGEVTADFTFGIGFLRTVHYRIHIADHTFAVTQEIQRQFKPGESHRVFYAPRSHQFLGALTLVDVPAATAVSPQLLEPLTPREQEVLQLLAAGLTNQEIADQLFLSVNTIKMYTSQLYQKLSVSRRTEAVARARELDLLTP